MSADSFAAVAAWNHRVFSAIIQALMRAHDDAVKTEFEGQLIVKVNYPKPGSLGPVFDVNNRIFRVER